VAGDLDRVHALVLDPRRFGTVAEREAYLATLEARYLEVETAMNRLMAMATWDHRPAAWVDDQLELVTAVVHQIGTQRGEYDDARSWGDSALGLRQHGTPLRRADLMLHLSEIHRVIGRAERAAELAREAADLLRVFDLSEEAPRRAGAGHLSRVLLPRCHRVLGGPPRRGPAAARPRLGARRRLDPTPVVAGQPRADPRRRRGPRGGAGLRGRRDRDGRAAG